MTSAQATFDKQFEGEAPTSYFYLLAFNKLVSDPQEVRHKKDLFPVHLCYVVG